MYKIKKRICFLTLFLLSTFVLVSCGQNQSQKVEETPATTEVAETEDEEIQEYSETELRSMAKAYYLNERFENAIQVRTTDSDKSGSIRVEVFTSTKQGEYVEATYDIDSFGNGTDIENNQEIDFMKYYVEGDNPDYIRFNNSEFEGFLAQMFQKDVGTVTADDLSSIQYFGYEGGSAEEASSSVENVGTDSDITSNYVAFQTKPFQDGWTAGGVYWAEYNGVYTGEEDLFYYSDSCEKLHVPDMNWMVDNVLPYLLYFDHLTGVYVSDCYVPGYMSFSDYFVYDENEAYAWDVLPDDMSLYSVSYCPRKTNENEEFLQIYGDIFGYDDDLWIHTSDYYPIEEDSHFNYLGYEDDTFCFMENGEKVVLDLKTGERIGEDTSDKQDTVGELDDDSSSTDIQSTLPETELEWTNLALTQYTNMSEQEANASGYFASSEGYNDEGRLVISIYLSSEEKDTVLQWYYIDTETGEAEDLLGEKVNFLE